MNDILKLQNNSYKTPYGTIIEDILSMYFKNFYEIAPYLILWHNKNLYYYDKNVNIYIKKLLKSDFGFQAIVSVI